MKLLDHTVLLGSTCSADTLLFPTAAYSFTFDSAVREASDLATFLPLLIIFNLFDSIPVDAHGMSLWI